VNRVRREVILSTDPRSWLRGPQGTVITTAALLCWPWAVVVLCMEKESRDLFKWTA